MINSEVLDQSPKALSKEVDPDVIYALRTVHQNQTQLNLMADQKANILVGLLMVIMTIFLSRMYSISDVPGNLLAPVILFVVLAIVAFVLALGVLIPRTIQSMNNADISKIPNAFFFGFFCAYSEDQYVDFLSTEMDKIGRARIFLIKDIYQVGRILQRKYKLLRYAYSFAGLSVVVPVLMLSIKMLS